MLMVLMKLFVIVAHTGQRQVTLQTVAMSKARKPPAKKRKITLDITVAEFHR